MENNTYNGWSNYATWRINLEWFGDSSYFAEEYQDVGDRAEALKDYVEESMAMEVDESSTAYSYALAFISDVNWYEIAESMEAE